MSVFSPVQRLTGGLLLGLASASAQASGLMLYEIGSDNTGLANAGAAARA
jgi:long-chain fatty acid transport protein